MIATGAMSPLEGYMVRADYDAVVEKMHLSTGLAWTIPITLAVPSAQAETLKLNSEIALYDGDTPLGILQLQDKYQPTRCVRLRRFCARPTMLIPGSST